jgi:hypothetical protein
MIANSLSRLVAVSVAICGECQHKELARKFDGNELNADLANTSKPPQIATTALEPETTRAAGAPDSCGQSPDRMGQGSSGSRAADTPRAGRPDQ